MTHFMPDPLADIRDRQSERKRGDWHDLIFEKPGVLSQHECEAVKHLFTRYVDAYQGKPTQDGYRVGAMWLGGMGRAENDTTSPIHPEGTSKIISGIAAAIHVRNLTDWHYDLLGSPTWGITSDYVVADRQDAGGSGGIRWHSDHVIRDEDKARGVAPKLLCVVHLSDPATYEGGELEIYSGQEIVRIKMGLGSIVVFPTFLLHRRLPVTRGSRFGFVTISYGACWR